MFMFKVWRLLALIFSNALLCLILCFPLPWLSWHSLASFGCPQSMLSAWLNIASWTLCLWHTQCFLWPQCTSLSVLHSEQCPRNLLPSGSSSFLIASTDVSTSDIVFYTRCPHLVFYYIYISFKNVYLGLGFYYHWLCFNLLFSLRVIFNILKILWNILFLY